MKYSYATTGTCARIIEFNINDDIISGIKFHGGCDGNLKAIAKILDGWTVEQIEASCQGNLCNTKATSCADQLSRAVRNAYNEMNSVAVENMSLG